MTRISRVLVATVLAVSFTSVTVVAPAAASKHKSSASAKKKKRKPKVKLVKGPKGDKGDKGDPGKQGPPGLNGANGTNGKNGTNGADGAPATKLWAVVNSDGTLARGSGVTTSGRFQMGVYFVTFNRDVSACAWVATWGSTDDTSNSTTPGYATTELHLLTDPNTLEPRTWDKTGSATDHAFHVAVFC